MSPIVLHHKQQNNFKYKAQKIFREKELESHQPGIDGCHHHIHVFFKHQLYSIYKWQYANIPDSLAYM